MRDPKTIERVAGALGASALLAAGASAAPQWTCGCPAHPGITPHGFQPPSDCAYSSNTPSSAYDVTSVYEIPVVVHVIRSAGGAGDIPDQRIIDQIQRLDDDYTGRTLGLGRDTGIRFRLATVDPSGQPTTGITRSSNSTWFMDQGSYWNSLAWDTTRYLNVYTLQIPFGAAGYVPDLPQSGIAGTPADRVVMLHQVFGQPQTEMILAHEVGHWLGLYHTFGFGNSCQNSDCHTQGDLICDTNPHRQPTQNCDGGGASCGVPPPDHNYMNYLDVSCMYEFTPEQVQRMRCTIENWRQTMAVPMTLGTRYCQAVANSTGAVAQLYATGSERVAENALAFSVESLPVHSFGFLVNGRLRATIANPGGSLGVLCIGGTLGRHNANIQQAGASGSVSLSVDLAALPQPTGPVAASVGETWNFQYWYRDAVGGMAASNFSDAVEIVLE